MKNGKITTPLTIENSLLNKFVMCIFEDSSGYLWLGTLGGLHMFKPGKLFSFTKKNGLSDNRIRCIFEDKRGNTWIGTENGLNCFNNGKFTVFTKKEGLLSNFIKCVFEDSKGNLWIGTDAGLNRLSNGTFTAYNPGGVFESNYVRYIYEDNQGILWFGTHRGLIRMKDEKTTIYTTQNGLADNYIHCIIEDETGKLWLGGPKGISFISKKQLDDFSAGKIHQLHPIFYNEKDGMKSQWCNSGVCKTRDEKLWFPTNGGIVIIDPKKTSKDTFPPSVIIEEFYVDGKPINLKSKEPLSLSPGKKRLEFHYTGVSFINPQKIKFKLKLVDYDRDWIDMGTARSTTYTELSPGHYTFKVIACNPDGAWNEQGAALSFYLKPHFHQTSWFYILASFFIVMMAFSLYRLRVRQLKNRERELSALVEVRTRDLKERTIDLETAHHKLKQSKEIIETKNRHIMDSIRYAQKIQQAMLPTKEKMARELTDYFVVFKPKDIVSGDFYWFDIIEDQYFLAVADCTGHGVPGALLSMIGYLMLNEAINEKRIFDPARALSHLHQGFRSVLKQELNLEENNTYDTYDGMDVGLCRIDLNAGQITFAGAGHSLFYIKDSELIEIKGNRKSIGGRQREEIRSFTNHQINIPIKEQKEIMIYLTTDGFADQHNPRNQKFGTRRLREFLRDNAHLNASKQKETLVKALETHQANEEQRDDITIIGIHLRIG
jgi:serine phosphatase RsbU (regulator of sigma subunit)